MAGSNPWETKNRPDTGTAGLVEPGRPFPLGRHWVRSAGVKFNVMGSQSLARANDRRMLEYFISLNGGAADHWEALGHMARNPEVRDLLLETAVTQRKLTRSLSEMLPKYVMP